MGESLPLVLLEPFSDLSLCMMRNKILLRKQNFTGLLVPFTVLDYNAFILILVLWGLVGL